MPEFSVAVKIKATSEDQAIEVVKGKLRQLSKETEDANRAAAAGQGAWGGLKNSMLGFGSAIAGLVGLSALVSWLRECATMAAEDERLFNELAMAMRGLANATDAQVEAGAEWIGQLEKASGLTNDTLIPAYINLLAAVKDTGQAQRLLEVAAGAAARGQGELGSNVNALILMLTGSGGMIRATDAFRVQLREAAKDGKLTREEIERLYGAYGDAGAEVENAGIKINRAKVAWDNTKEAVGAVIVSALIPLLPRLQMVGIAIGTLAGGLLKLQAEFRATAIVGLGSIKELYVRWREGPEAAHALGVEFANAAAKIRAESQEMATAMLENITGAFEKLQGGGTGAKAAGKQFGDIILGPDKGKDAKKDTAALADYIKGLDKSTTDYLEKNSEDLMEILNRARQERMKGERSITDIIAHELDAQFRLQQQELRKEQRLQEIERGIYRKTNLQELRDKQYQIKEELRWVRAGSEEEARLKRALGEVTRQVRQQEITDAMTAADALLGMLDQGFGKQKGIAIAQTIISTWASAQKSYEAMASIPYVGPALGLAAAAAAVAAGLARVKQIESTDSKGGGFDNPTNDELVARMAHGYGEKWARDFVNLFDANMLRGFNRTMGGASAPQAVTNMSTQHTKYDYGGNVTYQVNSIVGSDAKLAMRRFESARRYASRAYDRSIINRPAVKMGSKRAR